MQLFDINRIPFGLLLPVRLRSFCVRAFGRARLQPCQSKQNCHPEGARQSAQAPGSAIEGPGFAKLLRHYVQKQVRRLSSLAGARSGGAQDDKFLFVLGTAEAVPSRHQWAYALARHSYYLGIALIVLWTQGAVAQVEVGGAQLQNLSGNLGSGYGGQLTEGEQSLHDMGFNGNLATNGYYYSPNFLAFQAGTFYSRADSNAEATTLSNSEGYNLGATIFGGSQFPGYVSFGQNWGQNNTYGLSTLGAGLNTSSNNSDFSVSWLFKNLPVKNLAVYFSDSVNNTDIPGLGVNTNVGSKGFGLSTSGYNVLGFLLGAGYQHSTTNATSNLSGAEGGAFTSSGSSNVFHVMASRTLPWWDTKLMISAYRIMTDSSGEGSSSNADTNEFDASISSRVWRLPLSGTISYNDNVYGSVLQQLNSSGQLTDLFVNSPKIGELNTSLSSSYSLPHRIFVTGFVTHEEEFIGGVSVGATAAGGTASYGFGKFLKGLTLTVGMHDTASQEGNTGAGLVGAASYIRNVGSWRLAANAYYNQGIETLLATSTESSAGGNVSLRRNLGERVTIGLNAGVGRSIFSSVAGQSTQTKTAGVNLGWMRQTLSAYYVESGGTAIITNQGLVPVSVPGLVGSQVTPFNGKSYNAGYANSLIKHMTFSLSYGKFNSTGSGTGLFSNVNSELYSGSLLYTYRKLNFTANAAQSKQGASVTSALPSNIKVYYFGVSRWFSFF